LALKTEIEFQNSGWLVGWFLWLWWIPYSQVCFWGQIKQLEFEKYILVEVKIQGMSTQFVEMHFRYFHLSLRFMTRRTRKDVPIKKPVWKKLLIIVCVFILKY
jgi:hypothetical protein